MTDFDDDLDPLAPPPYGGDEPEEEAIDESDGGFSDREGIVRLWSEHGRLTKVRLSPVWFHKVPDAAALEARFREALMLSTLQLAVPPEPGAAPEEPELPREVHERLRDLPALSRRSLVLFDRVGRDLDARHAAALAATRETEPGAPARGRSKGVTVILNGDGAAERIVFDPKWLDDAQVGSICTHIMLAAERAYARHDEVERAPSGLDELAQERDVLRTALLTMLKPRDSRP